MTSRPESRPGRPAFGRRGVLGLFGAAIVAGLSSAPLAPAPAAEPIVGAVEAIRGQAFARPEGASSTRALADGAPVHLGEVLTTGADSRLHVALEQGGTLQLGADAAFVVDSMALGEAPSEAERTVMRLFAGPFRLAGAHEGTEVRARLAVLGVRGTDFWGGDIDGGFGVLVRHGVVEVITGGGRVTLDQPGQGVMLSVSDTDATVGDAGGAISGLLGGSGQGALSSLARLARPGAIRNWPADKVARAVDSVSLNGP